MCATNRARSASGKGSALIASVAVPIAALCVSAPDSMPGGKARIQLQELRDEKRSEQSR